MSSLEKRRTKNDYTYIIRFRDQLGRQHTKSLKTSTFSVAKKIQAKLDADLAEERWGIKKVISPIKVSEFRRNYIDNYSSINKAFKTVKLDNSSLKTLENIIGDVMIREISPRTMELFKSKRLQKVSPVTVNIELRHIKAAFSKAVEWDFMEENPMKGVKQLKVRASNLPKFLNVEQIGLLLEAIDNPEHYVLFSFYAGTGCRRTEALSLRWHEIDLENGLVTFSNTKNGKARIVPLRKTLVNLLYDYPRTEEKVFPFDDSYVSKLFRRYADKIGLPKSLKLHSLRHSFLTYAVATSKNLRGAQSLAGHSNVTVTEVYTHLIPEDLRSIVEGLPY